MSEEQWILVVESRGRLRAMRLDCQHWQSDAERPEAEPARIEKLFFCMCLSVASLVSQLT